MNCLNFEKDGSATSARLKKIEQRINAPSNGLTTV
jgi:hypothetical protein